MSRRRDGGRDNSMTGANAIPLGPRKGGSGGGGGTMKRGFVSPPRELQQQLQQQQYQQILSDRPNMPVKSMASESAAAALKAAQAAAANLAKLAQLNKNHAAAAAAAAAAQNDGAGDRGRPRKKKSRWGDEETKAFIPGMPATMPSNLTPEQEKAYIVQLQIEDITRKIKSGDYGIPINPEDRSPSPEPIYNGEGKRMNTREYRTRKRLEEERHRLILQMKTLNPEYAPPSDYKPMLQRVSERVAIPADVNPNINFVGLLIGPRGNTLKKIEKECNCKIMIRGKGSVKEGKVLRKDGQPLPGEDEPLHALVSSTALENVQKAVQQIREIIKSGIEQPEEENDLRKLQLMELAKLNGTLREDMVPKERAWLRPENQNITNTTVCTKCGGRGHIAQDCMSSQPSMGLQQQMQGGENVDRAKMDSEYMSLMAELGEGPPPSSNNNQQNGSGPGLDQNGRKTLMANPPFNNYGGRGARGGPRPPWMSGPPRGPPPNFNQGGRGGPRYGSRGGFGNRGPPMGGGRGGGGPPPWSQPPPYGGSGGPPPWGGPPPPQSSGGRGGMRPQYGGQGGGQGYGGGGGQSYGGGGGGQSYNRDNGSNYGQGGGGQSYNNDNSGGGGGYGNMPPPPPNQGGMGDSGNAPPWSQNQNYGGGGNMYGGGMNNNGGGGPPPPMYGGGQGGNNYLNQPPPPPPSSAPQPPPPPSSGDVPPWQQSSSGSDNNSSSTGTNSMASMYGSNMWGMPPMPVGPGPVPPPPPSGQDNSNSGQSGGMDYSAMYGMSQAPPPPPPPQTQ